MDRSTLRSEKKQLDEIGLAEGKKAFSTAAMYELRVQKKNTCTDAEEEGKRPKHCSVLTFSLGARITGDFHVICTF